MREIKVIGDHITLGRLLKLIGEAGTGGEARNYLLEHSVTVNGEAESRRGRKLRAGDAVIITDVGEIRLV
jgi:ribosome-associated protein